MGKRADSYKKKILRFFLYAKEFGDEYHSIIDAYLREESGSERETEILDQLEKDILDFANLIKATLEMK